MYPGGKIDDANEGLMQALKSIYNGTTRVIDLPVEINVTINSMQNKYEICKIQRAKKEVGNIRFKYVSGDKKTCDAFIKKKIYEQICLGELTYDKSWICLTSAA